MVIIKEATLNDYGKEYPDAAAALKEWSKKVLAADWQHFQDVKKTFNSADYAGNDRYVFDIKGNQFRLIVLIIFRRRTLFIRFFGTHAEYDKIDASQI